MAFHAPCPECLSPLRPCACERATARAAKRGGLRSRPPSVVHADDPTVYGPIFEWLRAEARSGRLCLLSGRTRSDSGEKHACADVWRATCHHSPTVGTGGDDFSCVGACGLADDLVHGRKWGWSERRVGGTFELDVRGVAVTHVGYALIALDPDGELRAAALDRGWTRSEEGVWTR